MGPPRMLFPVAIAPDALLEFNEPRDKNTHQAVVKTLQNHGVLTFGPGDEAALVQAVGQLVGRPHAQWTAIIPELRRQHRIDDSRVASIEDFIAGLSSNPRAAESVRLAIVESTKATDPTDSCGEKDTTELVALPDVGEAQVVRAAHSTNSFPAGTARDRVAQEFLLPLASRSRTVTVLDPHLFDDILGTARGTQRDHVEWIVSQVASVLAPAATLRLIGDHPSQRRQDNQLLKRDFVKGEIDAKIRDALSARPSPMTVIVNMVQAPKGEVKANNRYLDFDCGLAFEVTHDILRLGASVTPGPDDLTFRRLDRDQSTRARAIADGYLNYEPTTALHKWEISTP